MRGENIRNMFLSLNVLLLCTYSVEINSGVVALAPCLSPGQCDNTLHFEGVKHMPDEATVLASLSSAPNHALKQIYEGVSVI